VDVYFGAARFSGPRTVQVNDTQLRYRKAVIATGARAAAPPIPGLADVDYLTNETVFSLTQLPPRLGVIGAGPIGCELAQAFARLGSEVFLVETAHGILPREDPDAAQIVRRSLEDDGVKLLCCGRQLQLAQGGDAIRLTVDSHDQHYDVPIDKLLVAVGRVPNVDDLGLEKVGVAYDKSGVQVDDRLQTTNPRIFAAGDVCSQYKFTHAADFLARTVIRNTLLPWPINRGKASRLVIPWCTYTSPEIAHVGLYEKDAKEQGIEVETFVQELAEIDRAILDGDDEGLVKVHLKKGSDKIVGATIVAANAGDLISQFTLAMTHGLGLAKIADTIYPYPTQAEAIRKTGDMYRKTLLTPAAKRFLGVAKWLAGMG
jgi:pyruvate/2-oxoglutarate dehydrogenase complex dihydrolipoamide dehydrogenase (E3) component